ncbi:hypothetical protein LEN26_020670 [Aphanomyces euteiches]|nr:hypothetical protein LEN26_020670 [Aphanomyces euteiches]
MAKRKRSDGTGIVAAWEVFWDAMEDLAKEDPESISMFTADVKESDQLEIERAINLQPPEATMRELEELLSDPLEFQHMLTSFAERDSFMRILLRYETIQAPLLNLLLDLLCEYAMKANDDAGVIGDNSVLPSTDLTEKLVQSISTYPVFLQKDVIHILPEIVADQDFQVAVDHLLENIATSPDLVVPSIEALSNFDMPMCISEEVTSSILARLSTSPFEDMPALVRFLVQTATDQNAASVLNEIRTKISDCIISQDSSNDEAILQQQFVQGMSFRSDLLATFLKIVDKSEELHLMDAWSLVGFHSSVQIKSKAESIFVKKVTAGLLGKELLYTAFGKHLAGLKPYLKTVVHLAGVLLQSTDQHAREMGTFLFRVLFEEVSLAKDFMFDFHAQIVEDLVGFGLSTSSVTIDGALNTLLAFTDKNPNYLDKYLPLFKQFLDYIDTYNVEQSRHVYQLLFRVGGSSDHDLSITIRKQLYHQDNHYRRLGMIGYICCIEEEILEHSSLCTGVEESESPERDHFEKRVRDRLDILRDACRKQAHSLAFMYAELNHLVNRMPDYAAIINVLDEKYSDVLMNEFLPEFDPRIHQNGGYKVALVNGAFRSDLWALTRINSPVYLQLMSLIVSHDTRSDPLYLCNLLQLVVSCCKKSESLESIGTVLICPILLMEKSAISELGSMEKEAQDVIFLCLWHAINWCRGLLNCFGADASLIGKVLTRLENAVEFESILENAISNAPSSSWLPPGVEPRSSRANSEGKQDGKGKGKAAVSQVNQRWKAIRSSFTPLHPSVVGILPHKKDSIDPDSFQYLLDHFLTLLRKSLAKVYSTAPHWAAKSIQRSKPQLVHAPVTDVDGFNVFDVHLKFQLLNIADNIRWMLQGIEPPKPATMHALCMKYIECVTVVAKSEAFRQQNNPLLQLVSLQQLILPIESHEPVQDLRHSSSVMNTMSKSLMELQKLPCMDMELAVHLVEGLLSLETLNTKWNGQKKQAVLFSPPQEKSPLSELALEYLQRHWSSASVKPTYKPTDLVIFLEAHFEYAPHPLDSLQDLVSNGFVNLLENFNSSCSTTFPTLTKKTVGVFVRVSFETLVRVTSKLDFSDKNNSVFLLHYLHQAALLFKLLVGLTRSFQNGMVVASVLKHGSGFINNILRAMPYFESYFLQHNRRIMSILKEVQGGTRKLQTLCAHGKLMQDASAAAQVPKVKKLLERLIYETGKLARKNNVMDAFSTGILKQRNLDGSAAREAQSSEEEDRSTENPDEDSNDDEEEEE